MKESRSVLQTWKKQALAYLERNQNAEAGRLFSQIVASDRKNAEAWYYLGIVHGRLCSFAEAEACLRQAAACRPAFDQACYWLGMMIIYQNRPMEALTAFAQSTRINPRNIDAWNRLGKTHEELGNTEEAVRCFRKAIGLNPCNSDSHGNLGQALGDLGRYDQALASYRKALDIDPSNVKAALGYHLSLPITYRDNQHLLEARNRYLGGLNQLAANAGRFKSRRSLINDLLWSNSFYLAYQGLDDRAPQEQFGRFFREMAATALPQFMGPIARRRPQGRRIRVGYLTHFFSHHTVSYYFRSWIELANRDLLETVAYHLDPISDEVSSAIASTCDRYQPVTGSLSAIAAAIRNDDLDILVYPEIGMYPRHLWLAALRLAPIQCAAWGHPVTTGLASLDYFISADATEPPDAQAHYSETLVRLSGLGVHCKASIPPAGGTRAEFGLPEDRTLYLCSQSVFKVHVDTDALLAAVAASDHRALIVLFQNGQPAVDKPFQARLQAQFSARGLDPQRHLLFLPRASHKDYLRMNQIVDVMLDTLHWSGGRTSLDALACGLPIITLPGAFSRGRQTYGMLRTLELNELIATTAEEYVEKAVAVATDRGYRDRLKREILARSPGRIFEDSSCVRSLEDFFNNVMDA